MVSHRERTGDPPARSNSKDAMERITSMLCDRLILGNRFGNFYSSSVYSLEVGKGLYVELGK